MRFRRYEATSCLFLDTVKDRDAAEQVLAVGRGRHDEAGACQRESPSSFLSVSVITGQDARVGRAVAGSVQDGSLIWFGVGIMV